MPNLVNYLNCGSYKIMAKFYPTYTCMSTHPYMATYVATHIAIVMYMHRYYNVKLQDTVVVYIAI